MNVDVLIVGGGIAGLWLLAELRAKGVNALLVADELGKGQTIASQGIIHGGTKYALTGKLTGAALAIGDMPRRWREALQGKGAVDLSEVRVLAESQLLWTSGGVGSRLTGFFASKVMHSRMAALAREEYVPLFRHPCFHGSLYRLDEPVLDMVSLLGCLREQLADALMQVDVQRSGLQPSGEAYAYRAVLPDGQHVVIAAGQLVLTAGAGNGGLLPAVPMQRRPLQMVLVRGDLPALYAHALGMSDKPRATITSYQDSHGRMVWYIGGQPAEQGVGKPAADVIRATRQELAELLPWMDLKPLEWATWPVDRAETAQAGGSRPDQPTVTQVANVRVAWPTKLAFAPLLAEQLGQVLERDGIRGSCSRQSPVQDTGWPVPPVASAVWEQANFLTLDEESGL